MTYPRLKPLTIDEFLEWDSGDDGRYELREGEIVAMAPTKPAHQILSAKLARHIDEALDDRPPCTVRVEAPIAVAGRETCHQADLAVTCHPYEPGQKATSEPLVVVEILSPSTESYDRKVKLPDYRDIPSVREIVLIDQDQVYCEIHRRLDAGRWLVDLLRQPEACLRLDSIGLDQPLSAFYINIAFGRSS